MSLWSEQHAATIDPQNFRGHNQYLEQLDTYPYEAMVAWADAQLNLTNWRIFFQEDGSFGCKTRRVGETVVSRDLLDSLAELHFLVKFCGINPNSVLDVGAGYGRLAARFMATSEEGQRYTCTDAIAESIAVCERYRAHTGLHWDIQSPERLTPGNYDLAINIHSWSECTLTEVQWWIDKLVALEVPRLFIVPHDGNFSTWTPMGGLGPTYQYALAGRGFRETKTWLGPPCLPKTYALFER